MSKKIKITVRFEGRQIDGPIVRPIRLLPSGKAAAIYGGLAYPLYKGDYIETADRGIDKDKCLGFVEEGQKVPYEKPNVESRGPLKVAKWYLESNRFGHYLVFDGTEHVATELVRVIERSGLGVRRWDASYRPSADGYEYDWFIRLGFEGTREQCLSKLGKLLTRSESVERQPAPTGPAIAMTPPPAPAEDEQLRKQIRALEAQNAELTQTLTETSSALLREAAAREKADQKARKAAQQLKAERRQHVVDGESAERQLKATRQQLAAANEQVHELLGAQARSSSATEDETYATLAEFDKLREELDIWETLAAENEESRRKAESERESARQRNEDLKEELVVSRELIERQRMEAAEVQSELMHLRNQKSTSRRISADKLLAAAFPGFDFDADFLETLENAFLDWADVMSVLKRMENNSIGAERWSCDGVSEKDGVFEVRDHIRTGNRDAANMGRIYYKKIDDRRMVTLQLKKNDKDQENFVRRFARRYRAA